MVVCLQLFDGVDVAAVGTGGAGVGVGVGGVGVGSVFAL